MSVGQEDQEGQAAQQDEQEPTSAGVEETLDRALGQMKAQSQATSARLAARTP